MTRLMVLALGMALGAGPALAQKKTEPAPAAKKKGRGTPKRVIKLKGDVIEGKAQKPEAFYVLQRTSMTFDSLKLETKLIPKILDNLKQPPF